MMSKESALYFNENLKAGYRIYMEPIDTKTPTGWKVSRNVRIVVDTTRGKKYDTKHYPQTPRGQEEASKKILEIHKKLYEKRLEKLNG